MPEEQESLSLSEDTRNTISTPHTGYSHNAANTTSFNNRDAIDDADDTIKIQRIKLPLDGYHTVEVEKNQRADTINQSIAENGNGYGYVTDAINRPLPENGNGHEYVMDAINRSLPERRSFFEELTLEETAKLPVPQTEETNEHVSDAQTAGSNGVIEHADDTVEEGVAGKRGVTSADDEGVKESQPSLPMPLQTPAALPVTQPRNIVPTLRPVVRLWKFSRLLCIGILLIPILAICFYAYIQLNRFQNKLYMVDAQTGAVLWQHADTKANWTGMVDEQGNVQIVTLPDNEQQLVAFDTEGRMQWQSFSAQGVFVLPSVEVAPGTILAALSQQTALGHSLTLYSFNRATGHMNWQYEILQPARMQSTDILGADHNFIYALTTQSLTSGQRQVQLLAINQYTGYIGWRVNSPAEGDGSALDTGTLLLTRENVVWQVDATVEVIDETQGTLLWSTSVPFNTISMFQQEAQMAVVHGQVVIERNDTLHAFDITTGKRLWDTEVFDFSAGASPVPIAATDQAVVVYGNGQLGVLSLAGQHVIWQQRQIGNILGLHVSDDGTLIYAIILTSVEDSPPAEALLALDAQNGAVRWTFQLSDQYSFLHAQSDGFQYHQHVILTTLCVTSSCSHPRLYALNAATGSVLWKFEGESVSRIYLSDDGRSVSYEGDTSAWQQFVGGLSG